ncbi:hypothetical protein LPJ60_002499 [Coemansia sp. RSA 2675]|nr:hypothetical protein LPJ60_002499 [Coemansia sp. RSA 2675]
MSVSNEDTLCLEDLNNLYPVRAFFGTRIAKPKTRVELRMLKASAFIRSTPEWNSQLNDEVKCHEWTTQVKDTHDLADEEIKYVFEELRYYALLKENGVGGEELGAIDNVWIAHAASDCKLAEEFKRNAAVLESDFARAESSEAGAALPVGFKALVDPFLYSFSGDNSLLFETPIATPEAALDTSLPRSKPGSPEAWFQAIKDLNVACSAEKGVFDKRKVVELVRACFAAELEEEYVCWLPTDFYVNDDCSVVIPSYINNLHPVRYASLYENISKVFANFYPLLEQVTTDVIYPRSSRAKFDRELCVKPGMPNPCDIYKMYQEGVIPEEFKKYVTTWTNVHGITESHLDIDTLYYAYDKAEIYTHPAPEPFQPSDRPIRPYRMRGIPLQASVELASFNLTPENPTHPEGEWQAVGRAEERVFAVCLYFYDMENIASPKLKFRDPVTTIEIPRGEELKDFCFSHVVEETDEYGPVHRYSCPYTQEVGEEEIKSGGYICYPSFFQTKMPRFELADPTRPGHVKYLAFYIVDPTQRLVSTEFVPPQQPDWVAPSNGSPLASVAEGMDYLSLDGKGTFKVDEEDDAFDRADHLRHLHAKCNRDVMRRFSVCAYEDNN